MTMLTSTAASVMMRLLSRFRRKIGSPSTPLKPLRVNGCGQNCGTTWLMAGLVLNAVMSIQ